MGYEFRETHNKTIEGGNKDENKRGVKGRDDGSSDGTFCNPGICSKR